jgi:DNA repair exonuclease SbcCD nuclease subunit
MAFRFLHLADLHLDTNFGGRLETRERLRAATREAFERAVDYAIEHRLHAVLAAGDLYDDPILSLKTELWLVAQVRRLASEGIWFLATCGNHDPGAPHLRAANLGLEGETAEKPDEVWQRHVRLFRRPSPEAIHVTDRDGNAVGIVVGAGHASATETGNLAANFPEVDEPLPVVGILHTHVAAARASESHDRYAPSTATDYERLDYSYWALGHIHIRQRAVPGLPVFYAGNLQGRNPRETGEKGGYVVEAHTRASAEPAFVPFAPIRWERLAVDALPDSNALTVLVEDLARRIQETRGSATDEIAVRVELSGPSPLARELRDADERRQIEEALTARTGALEVQLRAGGLSQPFDPAELRESPTVVSKALELIEAAEGDPELLESLAPEELATAVSPGEERRAYLGALLSGLSEELFERSFSGDDP